MKFTSKIIAISFILLMSCDGKQSPISFNMEYSAEVTVPSSTGINLPFNLFTPNIETNTESTCEVNNTRKHLIKRIEVKDLMLTMDSPSGEDFAFLKSIEIFLKADGFSEIRVAWNENVDADPTSPMILNVTAEDLSEYIKQDEFSLRCKTITDEVISEEYTIGVDANFKVEAVLYKK